MSRLVSLLITGLLVAGCGSAGPTPEAVPAPTGVASTVPPGASPVASPAALPSTSPTTPPGASPAPTPGAPTAEPTGDLELPPSETSEPEGSHVAPELEALLPTALGGATLDTESDTGGALLDAWTRVMVAFLADAGKTADDLQFAQAWDAAAELDVSMMAFRVAGVPGPALREAVTEGLMASSPDQPKTTETISGKEVTRLTSPEDGWNTYIFDRDGVVYLVGTTDAALAASALAALP